jgi:hypothetical protein
MTGRILDATGAIAWQTEARRLFDLASKVQFRVVTITCPKDHELVQVRRIADQLVWSGWRLSRYKSDTEPTGLPPRGHKRRSRQYGFLDDVGNFELQPWGSCDCLGGNVRPSSVWLVAQCASKALGPGRRVMLHVDAGRG